jgi:transposase-like protein
MVFPEAFQPAGRLCQGNRLARERGRRYADAMAEISYRRHRFPPVVIQHAVWLYLRFTLSYRDVEDLLAERGLDVSYETIRSWVLKFGPVIARRRRMREWRWPRHA